MVSLFWWIITGCYKTNSDALSIRECFRNCILKRLLPGVTSIVDTGRMPKVYLGDLWYNIIVFDLSILYTFGAGVSFGFSICVFMPKLYLGVLSKAVKFFSGLYILGAMQNIPKLMSGSRWTKQSAEKISYLEFRFVSWLAPLDQKSISVSCQKLW